MTGASERLRNPYIGPRAFEVDERDLFFGRDEEIEILAGLVLARRAALFFAQSGAGKSSLLRAGLIPELTRQETVGRGSRARTYQRMRVLPIVTVGGALSDSVDSPIANVYVFRALAALLPDADPDDLTSVTLTEALAPFFAASESLESAVVPSTTAHLPNPAQISTLLIIDQFEELFTHDPARRAERVDLFHQVRAALDAYESLHILFTMREDYIAELTPYAALLPEQLRPRFRLEFLGEAAARQAIQAPARRAGVSFGDAATTKLVDDLRRVRVQRLDGTTEEQAGLYVEPVQLQVVCRRLWDNLPEGATEIVESDIQAVGDVDSALADYYADRVRAIAGETGVGQRTIREWVDRYLITEQGIRGQALQGREQSQGLDNQAIWLLVDAHLVRAEKLRGATWFELAHDRLVEPVRKNNAAWREANLSALQRQAALWEAESRPSGLLLRDQALVEAEAWAQAHEGELTDVERDFLSECQDARAVVERERRQSRRIRRLAVGATVFAIIAIFLAVAAVLQTQAATAARSEAEQRARIALSGQLAAQAQTVLQDHPQRSILLALEAFNVLDTRDPRVPSAEQALRDSLARTGGLSVHGHGGTVLSAAFSPDGDWLATGSRDNTVRVWDVSALLQTSSQGQGPSAESLVLRGHEDHVRSVAFSPDGRWLATGSVDNTVRLWDVSFLLTTGLQAGGASVESRVLGSHEDVVTSVAFSPDGRWLASGSWDNTVRLWSISAILGAELQAGDLPVEPLVLRDHEGWVWSVSFGPDSRWLASGSDDGTIRLWDVPVLTEGSLMSGEPPVQSLVLRGQGSGVSSVVFSPEGQWLASGSWDGIARLWDISALANTSLQLGEFVAQPLLLRGHQGPVAAVAFSPDGRRLATGSDDSTARLWDLRAKDPSTEPLVLRGHEAPVASVAFRPGGSWLATGSGDSTARLWNLQMEDVAVEPQVLRGHSAGGRSVASSPDGRWLASGNDDGTTHLWDVSAVLDSGSNAEKQAAQPLVLGGHGAPVTSVAFSPDGRWLATGSMDRTVRVWDVVSDVPALSGTEGPSAGPQTEIPTGPVQVLNGHESAVMSLAFSPDGHWLATGSDDAAARLWDVSATLAQGETEGLSTGQQAENSTREPVMLGGDGGSVMSLAFSPDSRWLATGSWDQAARLWDVGSLSSNDLQAGNPIPEPQTLRGHEGPVTAMAFSPDGRWLATGGGGWDDTARLWDLSVVLASGETNGSGQEGTAVPENVVQILRGHTASVSSVAFSPDGHWLATGSLDDTARLWDLGVLLSAALESDDPTAEPVVLQSHEDNVMSLAFSQDGRWLATSSLDGTVRLWRTSLDELAAVACQVAGRNLTQDEWEQYFGGEEYRRTCDSLPVHPSVIKQ